MKNLLSIALIAGMSAFYACGPSAEEKANREQAMQDSIAMADSMMRVAEQQAMDAAAAESMENTTTMDSSNMMMTDTVR